MKIRDQLIQELDEAREKMREIAELAGENPEIALYTTSAPWKIKELLAHIAGWDEITVAALRAHAQGTSLGTPADQGIDAYNAESVLSRAELPYPDIVRDWEQTREQFKQVLSEMPEEKFDEALVFPWGPTGMVAQIVRIMSHHELEHADEIRELLKQT